MFDHPEYQYLNLLRDALDNGVARSDRTGTGTLGLFGRQIRFDLSQGFPLLTTKKVHFKSVAVELLWFLRGDTHIKFLRDHGVTIWDEWADDQGDLGPVYGKQWRSWTAPDGRVIDQMAGLIENLKTNPYSRRHVVSAWNPSEIDDMALPPCHCLFQFFVAPSDTGQDRLSCQLYQRSADVFLGVPFNIASYALLTHMVAQAVGMVAGDFVHSFGDVHLYSNHVEQAKTQLTRTPMAFPTLHMAPKTDLFAFSYDDLRIDNYQSHGALKAPIAV